MPRTLLFLPYFYISVKQNLKKEEQKSEKKKIGKINEKTSNKTHYLLDKSSGGVKCKVVSGTVSDEK